MGFKGRLRKCSVPKVTLHEQKLGLFCSLHSTLRTPSNSSVDTRVHIFWRVMILNHVLYSEVNILSASAFCCLIANIQNCTDDMFGFAHINQLPSSLAQKHAYRPAIFGTRNSFIAFKTTGLRLLSWARWIQCARLQPLSQLCTQSVSHIVRCLSVFSSVCPVQIWECVRMHFGSPRTTVSYQGTNLNGAEQRAA